MPSVDIEVIKFGCIVRCQTQGPEPRRLNASTLARGDYVRSELVDSEDQPEEDKKFGIGSIYKFVIEFGFEDPKVEFSALDVFDPCWGSLMQAVRKLKGLESIDVWGHTRNQLARFVGKLDQSSESLKTTREFFRFHWLDGDRLREGVLDQDWQLTLEY